MTQYQLISEGAPLPLDLDHAINTITFHPNDEILAVAGKENVIQLWDVANRQLLGVPLSGHVDDITCLSFHPNGSILASGSADNTIRLWATDPNIWIDESCLRVGRNLTQEEWEQHLFWAGPYDPNYQTCPQLP